MPTLLDLAGLPIPASVEGQSMLPLARGEASPGASICTASTRCWA